MPAISWSSVLPKPPICSPSLRVKLWNEGIVTSTVLPGKETAKKKSSAITTPMLGNYSHDSRIAPWAMFRGRTLGVLKLDLGLGETLDAQVPSLRRAHCRSLRY